MQAAQTKYFDQQIAAKEADVAVGGPAFAVSLLVECTSCTSYGSILLAAHFLCQSDTQVISVNTGSWSTRPFRG